MKGGHVLSNLCALVLTTSQQKKQKTKKRCVPLADWALAGWLAGWLVGWLAGWLGAMCMDLASIVVQMVALMCASCLCSNLYGQVH